MTTLGDLVTINPKEKHKPSPPVPVITLADIDTATATVHPRMAMRPADLGSASRVVRPGDVIFARISPSMQNGKLAIVPALEADCALASSELVVLRPRQGIDPRTIWAYLRMDSVRDDLGLRTVGTAQQRLQPTVMLDLDWPSPSEAQMSQTIEIVDRVDGLARRRRDALVLLDQLPGAIADQSLRDCKRVPLGDLAEIEYGSSARSAETGDVPVLRIPNIRDGRIHTEDLRYAATPPEPRWLLEAGDVLMVRTNGNIERVGEAAVYEGDPGPAIAASYLLRIRPGRSLDADCFWAWLKTPEARNAIRPHAVATSQHNLSVRALSEVRVPVPGDDVRHRVGDAARVLRRAVLAARRQEAELADLLQACLHQAFGSVVAYRHEAEAAPRVAPFAVPRPLSRWASPLQRRVWRSAQAQDGTFAVGDLVGRRAELVEAERALRLLEELGLVTYAWVDGFEEWSARVDEGRA